LRTVAIVPSRFDSTRLPGKALSPMSGKPMLQRVLERVRRAGTIDDIVVATTNLSNDDAIAQLTRKQGARVFRGDPDDVLGRINAAAEEAVADVVVEAMGDSPLVHASLVDATVQMFCEGEYDYVAGYCETVRLPEHQDMAAFPVGMTVQVFSAEALSRCALEFQDPYSREHATSAMYRDPSNFRIGYLEAKGRWKGARRPDLFLAVNLPEQYRLVSGIFERCLRTYEDFGPLAAIRAADALIQERR